MEIIERFLALADDEVGSVGVTQKTGVVFIEYTLAATSVHYSAVFTLYDNAGTPTTVLTAGNDSQFHISDTDGQVCVYWATNQLKVKNRLGTSEEFIVKVLVP